MIFSADSFASEPELQKIVCFSRARRELREPFGETNRGLGGGVEERRIIRELPHLRGHRVDDFRAAVADVHAPQPRQPVEQLPAVFVVHDTPDAER